MAQNTSHAVMAQRVEAHDSLDFFPTPPWATRALCNWLEGGSGCLDKLSAWEPACGAGDMTKALVEYFSTVWPTDICQHGAAVHVSDFLYPYPPAGPFDWIITNPPFRLGQQFAEIALERAARGVALLVRTAFLESAERYESLFSVNPPTDVLQFVERVPMFKGRLDPKGSTATAYCWLVWLKRRMGGGQTQFHWIAPCRKRLERPGDYPSEELRHAV